MKITADNQQSPAIRSRAWSNAMAKLNGHAPEKGGYDQGDT